MDTQAINIATEDRLITITVGQDDDTVSFQLQEALLRTLSKVFAAALNNEHLGGGEKGVLRFSEDDGDAWKVLVYWILKRELPEYNDEKQNVETLELLLVHCWILGDKYETPQFQDLIMLELLYLLNSNKFYERAIAEAVQDTPPGSKMRELAAREIVFSTMEDENAIKDYEEGLSAVGFGMELMEAFKEWKDDNCEMSCGIGEKNGEDRNDKWKKFMVAGGPEKHWIYNDKGDDCGCGCGCC